MSIVIGTAGHIDHGKSTLVRALTGIDPDRLKEEKERGITTDIGFAHAQIGNVEVSFVDVPGHERFVKNMLAGVGGIDAVLLVVAADESVMPQTREHFEICRLLRIPTGVIAITKSDLADPETLELTTLEVRELVAGTFLEPAPIVPVSAATGAGLDTLSTALASLRKRAQADRGFARLPVDRVFTVKGFGTVVTGTLVSGELHADADLVVAPGGRPIKIRGLQVHGESVRSVGAGHRVAANLGGVDVEDVSRGDTLVSPGTLEPTRRFDVSVERLASAPPLRHGARVRFHQGTVEVLGRVSLVTDTNVRIRLEAPVVLARGDRFILRAYSPPTTIAGGEVLDPHPPRAGVRTEAGRARFVNLAPGLPPERIAAALIEEAGPAGLPVRALVERAGIAVGAIRDVIGQVQRAGEAAALDDVLVSRSLLESLAQRTLAELRAHHAAQPLSAGMPREELRSRHFPRAHESVFTAVLDRLAGEGRIVARERVALSTHRVELSPEEQRARDAITRLFATAGLRPPLAAEVATAAWVPVRLGDRIVQFLLRERVLVKVDDLLFHRDALERLKVEVGQLKGGAGQPARVDVASFKEKYGISRKFAIPLLEYLDRERVTRRQGDSRVVL